MYFTCEFLSKKIRKTGRFWTKNGEARIWDRSGCSKCVESRVLVDIMTWKNFQIFVDPENIFSNLFKNPDSHRLVLRSLALCIQNSFVKWLSGFLNRFEKIFSGSTKF